MTATCAVCMTAILTRSDVRVSGTEVMHADCARRGGETVNWRLRQQLANLHRDLEAANRRIKDLEHDVGAAETSDRRARRVADARERNYMDIVQQQSNDNIALQQQVRELQAELAAAARASGTTSVLAAATAGRQDQTSRPSVQQQPADDAGRVHTSQESERDPTEVRFSLLELDPL